MIRFFLLSNTLLCFMALPALAGPRDVPSAPHPSRAYEEPAPLEIEPEGELKPYHQLKVTAQKPVPAPLPEPEMPDVAIEAGEISISSSQSLLAYQGVLDPEAQQFRPTVWQYMTQSEATTLIAALPESIELSRLKDRIVTLFLLRADPPREASDSWLTIRLAGLNRLGAAESAEAMLKAIPPSVRDEMNPMALFTFFMRNGRAEAACEAIRAQTRPETVSEQEWQELSLFCQGALGDFSQVELALALAEESQTPYPDWLIKVVEHFQYPEAELPAEDAAPNDLGRLMIQAAKQKPLPLDEQAPEDITGYPQQPSYAIKAIAKLVRLDKLDAAGEWLSMLDTGKTESPSSYVAHELVRFLREDSSRPQSIAAQTIPPYTALTEASGADIELLARFYQTMQAFDYNLPAPTVEWLALHKPETGLPDKTGGRKATLDAFAKAGNKAGYLLALAELMHAAPVSVWSPEVLSSIIFDLKRLGEQDVARQLAAEAVLLGL